MLEETYRIQGNDPDDITIPSVVIQDELPAEPKNYVIEYALEGESTEQFDFSEDVPDGCGQVIIDITENGISNLYVSGGCDGLSSG